MRPERNLSTEPFHHLLQARAMQHPGALLITPKTAESGMSLYTCKQDAWHT